MKVHELIRALEDFDDEWEVRLAFQPSWPLQYHIEKVMDVEMELDDDEPTAEVIVYIVEGGQVYLNPYLPDTAIEEAGWGHSRL